MMIRRLQNKIQRPQTVEPTPAQMEAAERAMQAAAFRGPAVLVTTKPPKEVPPMPPSRRRLLEEQHKSMRGPLANLSKTPSEEFLLNFRTNGAECMGSAYLLPHPVHRSDLSGTLSTALPEDVFALIEAQISLVDDYLDATETNGTTAGDSVLLEAALWVMRGLGNKQNSFRESFLRDFESCIAAANDFLRMAERIDGLMEMLATEHCHLVWREGKGDTTTLAVRREASNVAALFSSDAVHAAQRATTFVMQTIRRSSIPSDLFSQEWEDVLVQNEVAVSIVRTFEDYLYDIHNFLDQDYLYYKAVAALVRSTVCFYVQCFVQKADQVRRASKLGQRRTQKIAFMNARRAVCRMNYDVEVFQDYFQKIAKENATLGTLVADELSVLVVLLECMMIAVGHSAAESLEEFVVVVHKRTGANSEVTKHFLSDLWLLVGPKNEHRFVENAVETMGTELELLSKRLKEMNRNAPTTKNDTTVLRLDEMLKNLYEDRIVQDHSLCGSILKDVKDLRDYRKDNPFIIQNPDEKEIPATKKLWKVGFKPLNFRLTPGDGSNDEIRGRMGSF